MYCFTVWRLQVQGQGACRVGLSWGFPPGQPVFAPESLGALPLYVCVLLPSSCKDTSQVGWGLPSGPCSSLTVSVEILPPNTVTFWSSGVRISTYELWGDTVQHKEMTRNSLPLLPSRGRICVLSNESLRSLWLLWAAEYGEGCSAGFLIQVSD